MLLFVDIFKYFEHLLVIPQDEMEDVESFHMCDLPSINLYQIDCL